MAGSPADDRQAFMPTGTLDVVVHHPVDETSDVRVALYGSEEVWLEEPTVAQFTTSTDTLTTLRFDNLPLGEYGAAVFLDENQNGKLDRNLVGWFKEPFGFSEKARARFGPPKWDDARFIVGEDPVRIVVRLDD